MSYIDRLNSFNLWLDSNALEPVPQLLYFKLLNVFNRAGWPESVQVDNQRIMSMTGQHSEKSAIAARDKLVSAGLISYKRGKKNSPGRYALTGFPCIKYMENNTVENIHCISGQFPVSYPGGNHGGNPAPGRQTYKNKEQYKEQKNIPPNPPAGGTGDAPGESAPVPDKPTRKRTPPTPPDLTPDEESALLAFSPGLCDVVRDWLRYKAERRFQYKPTGRRTLIGQICDSARQYGPDAVAAQIRQSIASGYVGTGIERLSKPQYGGGNAGQPPRESWAELTAEIERERGENHGFM